METEYCHSALQQQLDCIPKPNFDQAGLVTIVSPASASAAGEHGCLQLTLRIAETLALKSCYEAMCGWPEFDLRSYLLQQNLTHLLSEYGITHETQEFNGHGDDYWGAHARMTKEVMPFLAEHLETNQPW